MSNHPYSLTHTLLTNSAFKRKSCGAFFAKHAGVILTLEYACQQLDYMESEILIIFLKNLFFRNNEEIHTFYHISKNYVDSTKTFFFKILVRPDGNLFSVVNRLSNC